MDVSLGNDSGCTGFPSRAFGLEWGHCCLQHDLGGSDGALLDCLQQSVPTWLWPLVAFVVAVMVLYRPLYNWLQRKGWAK